MINHNNFYQLNVLKFFNIESNIFYINIIPIIYSLIAGLIIIFISLFLKYYLNKSINKDVNNKIYFYFYYLGNIIFNFINETIGYINKNIFIYFFSIFFITFIYNILVLIPYLEEPTKDLNVTLALSIYSVICIQYISFNIDKKEYMHHWILKLLEYNSLKNFNFTVIFINIIKFIINFIASIFIIPFNLLERFSLILSLSFRLFGNIFGGSMIVELAKGFMFKHWIYHLICTSLMLNIILMGFFGLFEGFIQALVFSLIGLNNIGILIENANKEN